MPITVEYKPDKGYVLFVMSGQVEVEEAMATMKQCHDDPDYRRYGKNIWMMSDVEFSATSREGFQRFGAYLRENRPADMPTPGYAAMVADGQLAFAMTRMFEMMTENESLKIKVFRDVADAEAWLTELDG